MWMKTYMPNSQPLQLLAMYVYMYVGKCSWDCFSNQVGCNKLAACLTAGATPPTAQEEPLDHWLRITSAFRTTLLRAIRAGSKTRFHASLAWFLGGK